MNIQVSVAELIEAFGRTYKSIDVRIAATKEKDSWMNAVTVVRLSHEEQEATAYRLQLLEQRFSRIQTEHFRINLEALPFTQWESFCSGVSTGVLHTNDESINLRPALVLNEQKGYLTQYDSDFSAIDSRPWPSLKVARGAQDSARFYDTTIRRELSAIGYSWPNDAIDPLFEAADVHRNAFNCDFFLYVPVFAFVSKMWINPSEKRVYISVVRHSEITGLRLTLSFHGRDSTRRETLKRRQIIDLFGSSRKEMPIREEIVDSEIADLAPQDYVRAALVYPAVGEICSTSDEVRRLIPPAQRNILLEALKRFCPDDQFRQLVSSPHSIQQSKLKESAVFERTVSWLLGLFGFSTINLGEFEHLTGKDTEVRLGSIDILASGPTGETLLLVSCTLGVPKEEDFGNLINVRAFLERQLLPETTCRILAVLFTGAMGYSSNVSDQAPAASVRVVNAEGMEQMLALLQSGEERRFFEFLNSPTFASL